MRYAFLILFFALSLVHPATAEHSIEVQRLLSEGEPFKALVAFEKVPTRQRSTEAIIAAARSAWALSLPAKASELFDEALRNRDLKGSERARVLLSRAIIEHQEGRGQVSSLFAERAADAIKTESALRAEANFVWGEALYSMNDFGRALRRFEASLDEASNEDLPEVHFKIGQSQQKLGKLAEAKKHFQEIPLGHERTPEAIRKLAEIAIEMEEYEQADFWLVKGRSEYPERFLDSWVDYARIKAAAFLDNEELVEELRKEAVAKYPPSDPWLSLLDALSETYEWKKLHGEDK